MKAFYNKGRTECDDNRSIFLVAHAANCFLKIISNRLGIFCEELGTPGKNSAD